MEKETMMELVKQVQTPGYLLDFDELMDRVQYIKKSLLPGVTICYAMKANPFLVGALKETISKFEVCSPGEFAICQRAFINMENIVLSGVYKEKEDLMRVLKQSGGTGTYTIESLGQLELLNEVTLEFKKSIQVLLRLSCGNQFGMDADTIFSVVEKWEQYPYLQLRGIQYYSGTQKPGKTMKKELEFLDEFCGQLEKQFQVELPELEYGPGLIIPYFKEVDEQWEQEQFAQLNQALEALKFQGKITLEMGRFVAASCGYYLTKLVDYKVTAGTHYGILDGGIHHLNYYGQIMGMKKPPIWHYHREEQTKRQALTHLSVAGETRHEQNQDQEQDQVLDRVPVTLCGALCTSSDVVVKQYPLLAPKVGDILVFQLVGAYSITEGIYLFLSRDLPEVYGYTKTRGLFCLRPAMATHRLNYEQ